MSWSPDGQFLLYSSITDTPTRATLWVLPVAGDRKPVAFMQTQVCPTAGQISPDGHWVVYQSNESGRGEQVYVTSFPGPGRTWQISTAGGQVPRWRPDGKEIFYWANNKAMAAAVTVTASGVEVGAVRPLDLPAGPWDVSPDGQRFLIAAPEHAAITPITLVVNWTAGLKK